jgi:hypothetical protein
MATKKAVSKVRTNEEIYADLTELCKFILKFGISKDYAREVLGNIKEEIDKLDTVEDNVKDLCRKAEDYIEFWLEHVGSIITKARADLKTYGCDFVTIKIKSKNLYIYNSLTDKGITIKIDDSNKNDLEDIILVETMKLLES